MTCVPSLRASASLVSFQRERESVLDERKDAEPSTTVSPPRGGGAALDRLSPTPTTLCSPARAWQTA